MCRWATTCWYMWGWRSRSSTRPRRSGSSSCWRVSTQRGWMKFVDEYRDAAACHELAARIAAAAEHDWVVMEVCGGQTHAIVRFGIDQLLPPNVELIHGPGCPVCVTPIAKIDMALVLAQEPGVVLCTFGDMLRVPGSREDLATV